MVLVFVVNSPLRELVSYIEHANNIAAAGWQVHLISPDFSGVRLSSAVILRRIRRKEPGPFSRLSFYYRAAVYISRIHADCAVVCYGRMTAILPLFVRLGTFSRTRKPALVYDLRTASIEPRFTRLRDLDRRIESRLFTSRIAITRTVGDRVFGHMRRRDLVLGVGSNPDHVDRPRKAIENEQLRMIYIGTYTRRELHDFLNNLVVDQIPVRVTLVGDGDDSSTRAIRSVQQCRPELNIEMLGRVPHDEIGRYLAEADVGIAYVPPREVYTYQPITKLYEYLRAGMPAIATRTKFLLDSNELHPYIIWFPETIKISEIWKKTREKTAIIAKSKVPVPTWSNLSSVLQNYVDRLVNEVRTRGSD